MLAVSASGRGCWTTSQLVISLVLPPRRGSQLLSLEARSSPPYMDLGGITSVHRRSENPPRSGDPTGMRQSDGAPQHKTHLLLGPGSYHTRGRPALRNFLGGGNLQLGLSINPSSPVVHVLQPWDQVPPWNLNIKQ